MLSLTHSQKSILTLLADGRFHSGTELAIVLGVSRSAVWKQLKILDELGLHYQAVSGKGYRLERALELLDDAVILNRIDGKTRILITSFERFDRIASTNAYLLRQTSEAASSGSVCLAEQQTAGKGRRGREWVSPFGSNIYLSILWRFQASPMVISGLSLAVGVAVIRALKVHYPLNFQLKWPNDIYFQAKKLGGILVEVSGESGGPCMAVVGLGLNLYLRPDDAVNINQAWIDLSQIIGQHAVKRNHLLVTLLDQLLPMLAGFEDAGLNAYLEEWRSYDCLKDNIATLYVGESRYEGLVRGIDDRGLLLLERADGSIQAYASGEVSFSGGA